MVAEPTGQKKAATRQTSSNYLATSRANLKQIQTECGHNLELQSMLLKNIRDFKDEQAGGLAGGQSMADMVEQTVENRKRKLGQGEESEEEDPI